MSFWGKLIGTDKALNIADTAVKRGFSLIDKAFDTDQEKGERKLALTNVWLKTQQLIGKESTPTAITRRVLAWGIFFLVVIIFLIGEYYIESNQSEKLEYLKGWVDTLWIGEAFMAAWTTYFMKHFMK